MYKPDYTVSPGEILKEYMEVHEIDTERLSNCTEIPTNILDDILNDKVGITKEIAVSFEEVFTRPAHFWCNLESNYRS